MACLIRFDVADESSLVAYASATFSFHSTHKLLAKQQLPTTTTTSSSRVDYYRCQVNFCPTLSRWQAVGQVIRVTSDASTTTTTTCCCYTSDPICQNTSQKSFVIINQ